MSKMQKALEKAEAARMSKPGILPWLNERKEFRELNCQTNNVLWPVRRDSSFSYTLVPTEIGQSSVHVTPVPKLLEEHRILGYIDDPKIDDYYSLLRTRILQNTQAQGHNMIMVLDSFEGEGATLVAINLAISIASDTGHSAILVDTQLRNPKLQTYLGLGEHKGLTNYLLQDDALVLIEPGIGRLYVLPSGIQVTDPTQILGSPRMRYLLAAMKSCSPDCYIILTASPLLQNPDALILAPYVDEILLVVEAGRTRREHILKTCDMLQGQHILGLVLNYFKHV